MSTVAAGRVPGISAAAVRKKVSSRRAGAILSLSRLFGSRPRATLHSCYSHLSLPSRPYYPLCPPPATRVPPLSTPRGSRGLVFSFSFCFLRSSFSRLFFLLFFTLPAASLLSCPVACGSLRLVRRIKSLRSAGRGMRLQGWLGALEARRSLRCDLREADPRISLYTL